MKRLALAAIFALAIHALLLSLPIIRVSHVQPKPRPVVIQLKALSVPQAPPARAVKPAPAKPKADRPTAPPVQKKLPVPDKKKILRAPVPRSKPKIAPVAPSPPPKVDRSPPPVAAPVAPAPPVPAMVAPEATADAAALAPIPPVERTQAVAVTQPTGPAITKASPAPPAEPTPPAYLGNPEPKYPRLARRRQWQGTVELEVWVDENGNPAKVSLYRSSGHPILDRQAVKSVSGWKFEPARAAGKPMAMSVRIPITFQLQ